MRTSRMKYIANIIGIIFILGIVGSIAYEKRIDGKESKRYKLSCENSNILTIRDGIEDIIEKNNASSNIVIDNINFLYTKELEIMDAYLILIDLEEKQAYDITIHSNKISYSKEKMKREDISLFEDRMNWHKFETILDKLDSLEYTEDMEYACINSILGEAIPFAFDSCKYYHFKDDKLHLLNKDENENSHIDFNYGIYLSEIKNNEVDSYTSANQLGFMILN